MPMIPLLPQRVLCRAVGGVVFLGAMGASCNRTQSVPPMTTAPQLRIAPPAVANPPVPVTPVEWVADAWEPQAPPRDWKYIVIHHTATSTGSVESIHRTHLARRDASGNPWRGIGYHFVIGNGHPMADGLVEPTFRWRDQIEGAHAGDATYNHQGIGICLIGNFDQTPPSDAQLQSLTRLVQSLSETYHIPPEHIKGHGDVKATACPGRYFPMQELTQILSGGPESFDATSPADP